MACLNVELILFLRLAKALGASFLASHTCAVMLGVIFARIPLETTPPEVSCYRSPYPFSQEYCDENRRRKT